MVNIPNSNSLAEASVTNLKVPSAEKSGFVELTIMLTDLYSQNISYVDSIGMILSTQATTEDGSGKLLTKGLGSGAVSAYARAW